MSNVNEVDWTECEIVETIPGKVSGVPLVKGTRMPADNVVENHESGASVEEISYNFDVTESDIREVLAYAASHKAAKFVQ